MCNNTLGRETLPVSTILLKKLFIEGLGTYRINNSTSHCHEAEMFTSRPHTSAHTHTTNTLVLSHMQSLQQAHPHRGLGSVSPRTSRPASPWPLLYSPSRPGLAMASARRDTKVLQRISPLIQETASNMRVVLPSYRRDSFTFTSKPCCTVYKFIRVPLHAVVSGFPTNLRSKADRIINYERSAVTLRMRMR